MDEHQENVLKNILTPREVDLVLYDIPYIVDLSDDRSALCFIGVEHSNDPTDKTYIIAKKKFNDFLSNHKESCIELVVESFIPEVIGDEEQMITKFGESGFLTSLAERYGLPLVCPEPSKEYGLRSVSNGVIKT